MMRQDRASGVNLQLDHDVVVGVKLGADLANAAPGYPDADRLRSIADLRLFLATHGRTQPEPTSQDLGNVQTLAARLRQLFELDAVPDAARLVNRLLHDAHAVPQLTTHDCSPYHLHYTPDDASLAQSLGAEAAFSLAIILRDSELQRLRTCEAPDCARVFVDVSRNQSRRYCDRSRCGNRLHAAAYRARQRDSARA